MYSCMAIKRHHNALSIIMSGLNHPFLRAETDLNIEMPGSSDKVKTSATCIRNHDLHSFVFSFLTCHLRYMDAAGVSGRFWYLREL